MQRQLYTQGAYQLFLRACTGGDSVAGRQMRFCWTANWDVRFERGGNEQSKVQRKASRVFAWSLDGRPYVKLHGYPSRLKMDTT